MHKFILSIIALLLPVVAGAHVSVKPAEVVVGSWQTFTVSVPVEKEMATVGVRLLIPDGLDHVSPNVKPGWNIEMVKIGEGEDAMVQEIVWTGGNIPSGMRDEFNFSARVPAVAGALQWKAYQTYADGSIVSWDASEAEQPKDATGGDDFSTKGPYSETVIIDDLKKEEEVPAIAASAPIQTQVVEYKPMHELTLLAVGMSALSLLFSLAVALTVWRKPHVVSSSNTTY